MRKVAAMAPAYLREPDNLRAPKELARTRKKRVVRPADISAAVSGYSYRARRNAVCALLQRLAALES